MKLNNQTLHLTRYWSQLSHSRMIDFISHFYCSSLTLSLSLSLSLQASFLFTQDNAMLLLSDWFHDCTFVIHDTMLIQLHRFIGDKLRDGFHIPKYRAKKSEISLDRSIESYSLFDNG